MDDYLQQLREELESTRKSIWFWSQPNARIGAQRAGEEFRDYTAQHIESLKRSEDEYVKLIADIEGGTL
ncbi:MAG: hypothetical protein V7672_14800 [Brevundimonas sp.]|uniref:hypothetical protein n=1 Tax=Brevundimonas sp. TaxID=1871086 RepID=UPI003001A3CB